jgi:hypothetical protein
MALFERTSTMSTEAQEALDVDVLRCALGVDEEVWNDVRAVGVHMTSRVPELIEAFYRWLSDTADFNRHFTDEPLLARVKAHQVEYWKDFLRAHVDEEYVERRRAVGLTHARIELGLMIYLRSMTFVSDWFAREIDGDSSIAPERPSASFSMRKLIHLDAAIVVDTYAFRTARMLEEHRERLTHIAGIMHAVANGDLSNLSDIHGREDALSHAVHDMVKSLRYIAQQMDLVARGDYSGQLAPRHDKDEMGLALQQMTRALRDTAQKNEQHVWMVESQTALDLAMSGNPSVTNLSKAVLSQLCRLVDAQVGAIYVLDNKSVILRLTGTCATVEGAGRAAEEKQRILLTDIHPNAIRVRWGLGEAMLGTSSCCPPSTRAKFTVWSSSVRSVDFRARSWSFSMRLPPVSAWRSARPRRVHKFSNSCWSLKPKARS